MRYPSPSGDCTSILPIARLSIWTSDVDQVCSLGSYMTTWSRRKRETPARCFTTGTDHSAAMIQLAHLFLDRFPVRYEFHGYSDLAEIVAALANREFSNCDVVVTFGYALVQVRKNPVALGEFATLISCVVPSHSCIVVAADAHNDSATRQAFGGQCRALETALNKVGVALEERVSTTRGSVMFARLTME